MILSLFFELLQVGIWGRDINMSLFLDYIREKREKVPWNLICSMAEEQSVIGPISEGIDIFARELKDLPLSTEEQGLLKPQKADVRPYLSKIVSLGNRYEMTWNLAAEVVRVLRGKDIPSVIVKGLGLAMLYPNPHLRFSSDIDILIPHVYYPEAKRLLSIWADEVVGEEANDQELKLKKQEMCIELHGTANMRVNALMDRTLNRMKEQMFKDDSVASLLGESGDEIPVPNDLFNTAFIPAHLLHHFYKGGISLKSYCDWAVFIKHIEEKDRKEERILSLLKGMRMMEEWHGLASFAVCYLGLPESEVPCLKKADEKVAKRLLDFTFSASNKKEDVSSESFIARKAKALKTGLRELYPTFFVFPKGSMRAIAFLILDGSKRFIQGK